MVFVVLMVTGGGQAGGAKSFTPGGAAIAAVALGQGRGVGAGVVGGGHAGG